jgi:hypothetical protein
MIETIEGVTEMSKRANAFARILLPILIVPLLWGCVHRPGGIAASNIPLEGREYRKIGPTAASDSSVWLFGILPVSGSNTTRQALDAAIQKKSADALIDITVEYYVHFWILFVRHVTSVRGTAIQFE